MIILKDLLKHWLVDHLGTIVEIDQVFIKQKIIDKINNPLLLSDQTNKTFNLINVNGNGSHYFWKFL